MNLVLSVSHLPQEETEASGDPSLARGANSQTQTRAQRWVSPRIAEHGPRPQAAELGPGCLAPAPSGRWARGRLKPIGAHAAQPNGPRKRVRKPPHTWYDFI